MDFLLRKMNETDTDQVAFIEAACFSDAWTKKQVGELTESPYDEVWVAESGTKLAGYINFRFLAGEGELMRIAVLPQFRGRGLSRKLMGRMEKSAGEQGVAALTLEVRAGNTAALNLYKSCGFSAEALRKHYYCNPTEDAVIMWRRDLPVIPT